MDEIDRLLAEYRDSGPETDRGWILRQLEDKDDPRVMALLRSVVLDSNEEDYLRAEVLAGLRVREGLSPGASDSVAAAICSVLQADEDQVVREHAAMSLVNFIQTPGVVEALERVVFSNNEDENLRCCALDSLEANAALPECRAALVRLSALPDFGPEIAEKLRG